MKATNWIIGITGGIAAYKTPELVRLLKRQGASVRVVLSQGAKAFVTPMTLQALTGNPVYSELLDTDFEAAMGHIELAKWADAILIAPASANRIAALAHGMADDLLTTLCLASSAPLYVAPAMNQQMWHHPATQANLAILQERGVTILGPDEGEQACGDIGMGRMMEPEVLYHHLNTTFLENKSPLHQKRILITAGPTREAIDPVRYISNRSSGKMGFALAQAAINVGAKVTLISGPVALKTPVGVERVDVTTAQEMLDKVMKNISNADIFISAAAVADFQVEEQSVHKIKKESLNQFELKLIPTPDILAHVAKLPQRPYCVGFAAETQNLEANAKKKLIDKKLDLIALNDVSKSDIGFDVDANQLTVISPEESYIIPKASKFQVAVKLLDIISEQVNAKNKTKNS
ncbi:MAG: bifunctional phosphopantothenoylcysteine decarboxylase/phosphopantothenate--cysteine ligase CoaBC [Gammaproteobacteria bacterium]|nr:bifunctional phosphopantothenoylcysteine decarboxylase/phosphopantothenate--cysteine ligase CoaBC [Gammaproteobacteria bacterium]